MAKFTIVASQKDGKTVEHFYDSASRTLHDVHALRKKGCTIVTIYRDGAFLSEDDLVIQADEDASNGRNT